ncbi:MAG TPA: hypothetical protein VIU39_08130 [Anaerolineales bacterium]
MKSFFSPTRLLVVLLALGVFAVLWAGSSPYRRYWLQQRQLAAGLGVRIGDYPNPDSFPVGYFRDQLRKGMPAAEVHSIVSGYETAYRCADRGEEVYYYFSPDDARALRFTIVYDGSLNFDSLGTEDAHQRTISVEGCTPGLSGD